MKTRPESDTCVGTCTGNNVYVRKAPSPTSKFTGKKNHADDQFEVLGSVPAGPHQITLTQDTIFTHPGG